MAFPGLYVSQTRPARRATCWARAKSLSLSSRYIYILFQRTVDGIARASFNFFFFSFHLFLVAFKAYKIGWQVELMGEQLRLGSRSFAADRTMQAPTALSMGVGGAPLYPAHGTIDGLHCVSIKLPTTWVTENFIYPKWQTGKPWANSIQACQRLEIRKMSKR